MDCWLHICYFRCPRLVIVVVVGGCVCGREGSTYVRVSEYSSITVRTVQCEQVRIGTYVHTSVTGPGLCV